MKKTLLAIATALFASFAIAAIILVPIQFKERPEKRFAIVIASYNNAEYVDWNIMSALSQDYKNFHIVYVNDCSTDGTVDVLKEVLERENKEHMVTIIDNKVRSGALKNIHNAIHNHTDDNDIIVSLDGDDALADPHVLSHLNKVYTNPWKEVWMTYGQFQEKNSGTMGFCKNIKKKYIKNGNFRDITDIPSHLRTFYSWLFKRIEAEDLKYEGEFFTMSWDMAFMFPMIEMANNRFQFIPRVMYIYNDNNPISDHRVNCGMQRTLDKYIRSQTPYEKLEKPPVKTNI